MWVGDAESERHVSLVFSYGQSGERSEWGSEMLGNSRDDDVEFVEEK